VRHKTEPSQPLTLSLNYKADLDSQNSNWDVVSPAYGSRFDIGFNSVGLGGYSSSGNDAAIVSGPASYETCSAATNYSKAYITRSKATPGMNLCVRTSEKRYAFLTIKKLLPRDSATQIELDVRVWDPPFEESGG
jgi:hypothetical protein